MPHPGSVGLGQAGAGGGTHATAAGSDEVIGALDLALGLTNHGLELLRRTLSLRLGVPDRVERGIKVTACLVYGGE